MIQRIQSLYLLAAAALSVLLLFIPVATTVGWANGVVFEMYLTGIADLGNSVMFWLFATMTSLACLTAAFALISIFLYKNRKRQVLTTVVAFIANVLLFGAMMIYSSQAEKLLNTVVNTKIAFFIPIVTMFLLIFATKAIRRDEAMVRSADRLR